MVNLLTCGKPHPFHKALPTVLTTSKNGIEIFCTTMRISRHNFPRDPDGMNKRAGVPEEQNGLCELQTTMAPPLVVRCYSPSVLRNFEFIGRLQGHLFHYGAQIQHTPCLAGNQMWPIRVYGEARWEQRRFVMVFMKHCYVSSATTLQLYLVTCDKAATVSVTVSQPSFNKTVHVDKDSSGLVTLDYTYMISEGDITSKVILITSDVAISVFAFYTHSHSADATACMPEENLGQEYYIFTPKEISGQEFAVANGFETIAHVDVTVSGTITYKGITYNTGSVLSLSLKQQEVIQFVGSDDLTGTKISSSAPVAVFTGDAHYSGYSYNYNTLVEQLHPVQNWGTFFAVFPFLTHTTDVIDIMAASSDTIVSIDSPQGTSHHNLTAGASVQLTADNIMLINSSKPIMVSYLFQQTYSSLGYYYDPFLTTVPPSFLGRRYYQFVTQSSYDNFIIIVSQASSDVGFYLDGKPLSSYSKTKKEFNWVRGWQVTLGKTEGKHEIYHNTSIFTLYVFEIKSFATYGYSADQDSPYTGMTLRPM
ncbi:IgGFc-binding protein-like [Leptodactylus fuscus]